MEQRDALFHCDQILSETQPHCEADSSDHSNSADRQEDSSQDMTDEKEEVQMTPEEALVPSPAPAESVVETIKPQGVQLPAQIKQDSVNCDKADKEHVNKLIKEQVTMQNKQVDEKSPAAPVKEPEAVAQAQPTKSEQDPSPASKATEAQTTGFACPICA